MSEDVFRHNYWNEPGVPHKNWTEICVVDKENEHEYCEMCGKEDIRYVHVMNHKDTGMTKRVGCVCAENMCEDYVMPRKRERWARNKAKRKQNFLKKWGKEKDEKTSYFLNYKGHDFSIIPYERLKSLTITFDKERYGFYKNVPIRTLNLAKCLLFDRLERSEWEKKINSAKRHL